MTPTETLPALRSEAASVRAEDFMPVLNVTQAVERKKMMNEFISKVLINDVDYGEQPGGGDKKVLKKSGAEKLCSIFGLSPRIVDRVEIEDWTGKDHGGEPFFYYRYTVALYRGDRFMGEAVGSCNSWESKYRYRWVSEEIAKTRQDFDALPKRGGRISEPKFAIDKAETGGKFGKPAEYWQRFRDAIAEGSATEVTRKKKDGGDLHCWEIDSTVYRIPNPDAADTVNTCQKMAHKRALVAPVLIVTNCSDAFTQDVEDFEPEQPMAHAAPKEKAKAGQQNLDQILSKMVDKASAVKAFEAIKKGLRGLTGDDKDYYTILGAHGWEHANEFKDLAEAKAALTEIYWRGVSISEKQGDIGPEPPQEQN